MNRDIFDPKDTPMDARKLVNMMLNEDGSVKAVVDEALELKEYQAEYFHDIRRTAMVAALIQVASEIVQESALSSGIPISSDEGADFEGLHIKLMQQIPGINNLIRRGIRSMDGHKVGTQEFEGQVKLLSRKLSNQIMRDLD